ncbi:hypothetical protein ZIOFF_005684 [Zingiber officinale]|uniref:Uncharacterized protein n=1 Tax=Zingiber officinale TaxID=94328 RepID=A0A8J5IB61_ZINOF|nr:hypothetical protein ZIOFF_005684 [Zingiber officinale]
MENDDGVSLESGERNPLLDKSCGKEAAISGKFTSPEPSFIRKLQFLGSRKDSQGVRTKEQFETLMCYLEETFELQKCVVATGQKFTEMQSKTNSIFSGADAHDKSIGFNLRQFADIIRTSKEQL